MTLNTPSPDFAEKALKLHELRKEYPEYSTGIIEKLQELALSESGSLAQYQENLEFLNVLNDEFENELHGN